MQLVADSTLLLMHLFYMENTSSPSVEKWLATNLKLELANCLLIAAVRSRWRLRRALIICSQFWKIPLKIWALKLLRDSCRRKVRLFCWSNVSQPRRELPKCMLNTLNTLAFCVMSNEQATPVPNHFQWSLTFTILVFKAARGVIKYL